MCSNNTQTSHHHLVWPIGNMDYQISENTAVHPPHLTQRLHGFISWYIDVYISKILLTGNSSLQVRTRSPHLPCWVIVLPVDADALPPAVPLVVVEKATILGACDVVMPVRLDCRYWGEEKKMNQAKAEGSTLMYILTSTRTKMKLLPSTFTLCGPRDAIACSGSKLNTNHSLKS